MRQVKTARGKTLDMAALAKKNEDTKAVSNVPMNAKGDRLDSKGNVKTTVQTIARAQMDVKEAPEQVGLSNPKPSSKKAEEKIVGTPVELSRTVKSRDDGSSYEEIEYDDGSFETVDIIDTPQLKTTNKRKTS